MNPREQHPIRNVTGHAAHTGATGLPDEARSNRSLTGGPGACQSMATRPWLTQIIRSRAARGGRPRTDVGAPIGYARGLMRSLDDAP